MMSPPLHNGGFGRPFVPQSPVQKPLFHLELDVSFRVDDNTLLCNVGGKELSLAEAWPDALGTGRLHFDFDEIGYLQDLHGPIVSPILLQEASRFLRSKGYTFRF